jgi:hypothetical protein
MLILSKWINTSYQKDFWEHGIRVRYRTTEALTREKLLDYAFLHSKWLPHVRDEYESGFYAGWKASRENPEVE